MKKFMHTVLVITLVLVPVIGSTVPPYEPFQQNPKQGHRKWIPKHWVAPEFFDGYEVVEPNGDSYWVYAHWVPGHWVPGFWSYVYDATPTK